MAWRPSGRYVDAERVVSANKIVPSGFVGLTSGEKAGADAECVPRDRNVGAGTFAEARVGGVCFPSARTKKSMTCDVRADGSGTTGVLLDEPPVELTSCTVTGAAGLAVRPECKCGESVGTTAAAPSWCEPGRSWTAMAGRFNK
jgi:hypothetical protein